MMLSLLLMCVAFFYIQVIVVKGFNTEVIELDGYRINLRPESRQAFGGLSWGLLRYDLEDRLDLGISANIGKNRDVTIRLEKDDHILVISCRSDQSGVCYSVFRDDNMKMSGDFKLMVLDGMPREQFYQGNFHRQSRLVFLLKEFLLSV